MKLHVKSASFSTDNGQTSRFSFSYRISNDKTSSQNISITLSHILLKLHEHRGVRVGVKSSCERFCKVPSAENYCWSKIVNGVITLLWQPRCHFNPDHDKFSVLIQLWWQFFQMCVYRDVVYVQTWYWAWKKCIEPPSYASTAYVVAIWRSFVFDSFVKIWTTWAIFLGKWLTAPPPAKNFLTPMIATFPRISLYR